MMSHKDYDICWVVGVITDCPRCNVYMAWGGNAHNCYIDHSTPKHAEKFDSPKEARDYIKKDPDAKRWFEEHPGARILKMRYGFTVYSK